MCSPRACVSAPAEYIDDCCRCTSLVYDGIVVSGAQTDGIHETRKRAAFFVACLSVALCVLGSMRAVATFRANLTPLNSADIAVLAWMALPLALATTGMLASLSRWMGPIWICTGALFGFVIVAAWSLGLFYGYGALVMFVAALIHLAAVRPGWKTVLVPLWMLAGTSGVSAVFFVRDVFQSNEYQYVTHAPIVVWGSETFIAISTALLVVYGLTMLRKRR